MQRYLSIGFRPRINVMSIEQAASARLPTPWGDFLLYAFRDDSADLEHLALAYGDITADKGPVLSRVHSQCLTGDALFSLRCDCGAQLRAALQAIAREGRGVLLYLRQEGRGIGLANKICAYALQDLGADTVEANEQLGFPADLRSYDVAVQMYRMLGVASVRLMTNNPRKIDALREGDIEVVERVPIEYGRNHHNEHYLATKATKMGHQLAPAAASADSNGH